MKIIAKDQGITLEPFRGVDPLAVGEITADPYASIVLAQLTPSLVRFAHRLVCFDLPPRMIGHFRSERIFIQKASAAPDEPTVSPPAPEEIPTLVEQLCECWRVHFAAARSLDEKLQASAEFFHGFLYIHPFADGNGRVARSLLMQQALEMFGHVDMSLFDRGAKYYAALQAADAKNFTPLKKLIHRAVTD
jgi:Fic family protein